jgi:hypothetical protein
MERSTASQPLVSESQYTEAGETGTVETAPDTLHIEHEKLPSIGSGPIFPFSEIFSWISSLFKRVRSSHEAP